MTVTSAPASTLNITIALSRVMGMHWEDILLKVAVSTVLRYTASSVSSFVTADLV